MKSWIQRGAFRADVDRRSDHLLVAEGNDRMSVDDMPAYLDEVDRLAAREGVEKAIFDARKNDGPFVVELRDERWSFFEHRTRLSRVAVILPDELTVTRVNMTAIAKRIHQRVRGFVDVPAAERWLGSGR